MHRRLDDELESLRQDLVRMAGLAERMIEGAIRMLVGREAALASEVFRQEQEINELDIRVDERAVEILARYQPVAADLRFLLMASKMGGELERIGDQAVNIVQNVQYLLDQPPLKPLVDVPIMADAAQRMVRDSLEAFLRRDAALADRVLEADDKVDAFKDQIFRVLLTYMMSEPATIPRALALILVARNLEKIGDHATNIAEEVIYLVHGRDVRHHHEEKLRGPAPDAEDRSGR